MTHLYRIRVVKLNRSKRLVVLRVYCIYYDGGFTDQIPTDPSFFIMILGQKPWLMDSTACPINKHFELDTKFSESPIFLENMKLLNREWLEKHTKEYIQQVKVLSYQDKKKTKKKEPKIFGLAYERLQRQAVFEIKVTDSKWLQHLIPGMVWHTAAFDMLKGTTGVKTTFCCDNYPDPEKVREEARAKFRELKKKEEQTSLTKRQKTNSE